MAYQQKKLFLHEILNLEDLEFLEERFRLIAESKEDFNFIKFEQAIKDLGVAIDPPNLEVLFNGLDVGSTGILTWDTVLIYLQNEIEIKYQKKITEPSTDAAVSESFHVIHTDIHEDIICRIDPFPKITSYGSNFINSHYVTASKEGVVAIWSSLWRLQKHTNINLPVPLYRKVKNLILDMVCLPNVGLIALSCSDDQLRFYDFNSLNLIFLLNELSATVTIMNYWFDPSNLNTGILLYGDTIGTVTVMTFTDCLTNNAFGAYISKMKVHKISERDLAAGSKSYVHLVKYKRLHNDWIKQLRYDSSLKCVMSCSNTSEKSLVLLKQGMLINKEDWVFNVPYGINSFEFNEESNLLATGGIDRTVRVWNPYITARPLMSFSGHSSPVTHIFFSDENQLFSLSTDKTLMVWNLNEGSRAQKLMLISMPFGVYPISAVCYNPWRRMICFATTKICLIYLHERECDLIKKDIFDSHPKPITGVIYNEMFNQVISTCQNGLITIWDIETGRRVVQIQRAHFSMEDGEEVPKQISALCLSANGKYLVSCGLDGFIKVWNLVSGCLLMNIIEIPEQETILTILSIKDRIYFAGWNKRVYSCLLDETANQFIKWTPHHTEDILSMCRLHDDAIVCGSWDGKISLWIAESELIQSSSLAFFLSSDFSEIARRLSRSPSQSKTPVSKMSTSRMSRESTARISSVSTSRTSRVSTSRTSRVSTSRISRVSTSRISRVSTSRISRVSTSKMSKIARGLTFRISRVSTTRTSRVSSTSKVLMRTSRMSTSRMSTTSYPASRHIRKQLQASSLAAIRSKIFRLTKSANLKDKSPPIMCVLCLQKRALKSRIGNVLVADLLGRIQVWSSTPPFPALAIFASVTAEGQYTTCMTTDSNNYYLVTGDSAGFVRVWYIRCFCSDLLNLKSDENPDLKRFPFCLQKLKMVANKVEKKLESLRPYIQFQPLDTDHPPILTSYQAHLQPIVQIVFVESKSLVITGSADQSVRLWTLQGRFLGIFGDPRGWNLTNLITPPIKSRDRKVPSDIRRVASATTLQVLFSGLSAKWWKIREVFLYNYIRAILKRQSPKEPTEKLSKTTFKKTFKTEKPFLIRRVSRKATTVKAFSFGPTLGNYFSISNKDECKLPAIIKEEVKKHVDVVHKYVHLQEIEPLAIDHLLPSSLMKRKKSARTNGGSSIYLPRINNHEGTISTDIEDTSYLPNLNQE